MSYLDKLPDIVDIANQYGIQFNDAYHSKVKLRARCPFCNGNEFSLAVNSETKNFICFRSSCGEKGGVLHFESKLSGKSLQEVKEKYFKPNPNKIYHKSEKLSPYQLQKIGWNDLKRKNYGDFYKLKEQVAQDWELFEYFALAELFGLFLIAFTRTNEQKQAEQLAFIIGLANKYHVDIPLHHFFELIFDYEVEQRTSWAKLGSDVARSAFDMSVNLGDGAMKKTEIQFMLLFTLIKTDYYFKNPTNSQAIEVENTLTELAMNRYQSDLNDYLYGSSGYDTSYVDSANFRTTQQMMA